MSDEDGKHAVSTTSASSLWSALLSRPNMQIRLVNESESSTKLHASTRSVSSKLSHNAVPLLSFHDVERLMRDILSNA